MANIKLIWSGAFDNVGIQGYELGWKHSTSSSYNDIPFISSSSPNGEYNFYSSSFGNTYNFRLRTKNTQGLYSPNYIFLNVLNNFNNPPTPPTSSTKTPNVTSVFITWAGATDDIGIAGYNLYVRKTADNTLSYSAFISSSSSMASHTATGLSQLTNYYYQINTKDIGNLTSSFYTASFTTSASYNYKRSADFQTDFAPDLCDVSYPTINVYTTKQIDTLFNGDFIYNDSNLTIPFNGSESWWRIGGYGDSSNSYQIGFDGMVLGIESCAGFVFNLKRSTFEVDYPLGEAQDACDLLTVENVNIYTDKPINLLQVGDIIYTNSGLGTTFNGAGDYWLIADSYPATQPYSMRISAGGVIQEILVC